MRDVTDAEQLKQRMHRIRSGSVSQGTTLTAWCRESGHHRSNVYKALLREWTGPGAQKIVREVLSASGVEVEP